MSQVPAYGSKYIGPKGTPASITIYPLKENKRPLGFAPWPERPEQSKKKTKRASEVS
jgi:hypothetical protein